MNIELTEALDGYVQQQISSGVYRDSSDVIAEALRLKMRLENRYPQAQPDSPDERQAYLDGMAHRDGHSLSLIEECRHEVGG